MACFEARTKWPDSKAADLYASRFFNMYIFTMSCVFYVILVYLNDFLSISVDFVLLLFIKCWYWITFKI